MPCPGFPTGQVQPMPIRLFLALRGPIPEGCISGSESVGNLRREHAGSRPVRRDPVPFPSVAIAPSSGTCGFTRTLSLGVSNSQERSLKFYDRSARFRRFPAVCWTRRGTLENNQKGGTPLTRRSPAVEFEQIRFMWKDEESNIGDCPALYEVDGGYVVQGKVLGDQTKERLRDLGKDETAVFVPANVLDRLRA